METETAATRDLIKLSHRSSVERANTLMKRHRIRHLPITDDAGTIIGILSDRDLARAMRSELDDDPNYPTEILKFDPDAQARDYMSWPVISVEATSPMLDTVRIMLKEKISAVLITQSGAVEGILTTDDLLRVLALFLEEDPTRSFGLRDALALDFEDYSSWR